MPGFGDIRAGRAFVEILADQAAWVGSLDETQKAFRAWSYSLQQNGRELMELGGSIFEPMMKSAEKFTSVGAEIAHAMDKTGLGAATLSQLRYAADQTGVSFDGLQTAMKKLATGVFEDSKKAQEAFKALGISARQLHDLSPEQQLLLIADKFKSIENPTNRAAIAMDLFGRSGMDLIPMLDQGSAGIEQMMHRADALGITMSDNTARAAEELERKQKDLNAAFEAVEIKIGSALAPALELLADDVLKIVPPIEKFIDGHHRLVEVLAVAGAGVVVLGGSLVGLSSILHNLTGAFELAGRMGGMFGFGQKEVAAEAAVATGAVTKEALAVTELGGAFGRLPAVIGPALLLMGQFADAAGKVSSQSDWLGKIGILHPGLATGDVTDGQPDWMKNANQHPQTITQAQWDAMHGDGGEAARSVDMQKHNDRLADLGREASAAAAAIKNAFGQEALAHMAEHLAKSAMGDKGPGEGVGAFTDQMRFVDIANLLPKIIAQASPDISSGGGFGANSLRGIGAAAGTNQRIDETNRKLDKLIDVVQSSPGGTFQ